MTTRPIFECSNFLTSVSHTLHDGLATWRNEKPSALRKMGAEAGFLFLPLLAVIEAVVKLALSVLALPFCYSEIYGKQEPCFVAYLGGGSFMSLGIVFLSFSNLYNNLTEGGATTLYNYKKVQL